MKLYFDSLTTLKVIHAESPIVIFFGTYGITYIEREVFTGLTSLRVLDLRDNEIAQFPELSSLYNLQILYLDNNKLDYLSDTAFVNTTMLSFISISNNLFVIFQSQFV